MGTAKQFMSLQKYIYDIGNLHKSGKATEHSYRPALQAYLTELFAHNHIDVTNEPKRQKCGAPDYILSKKGIDVGYIEAKDIGIDLGKTEKSEQLTRYRESLENLILTDYLEFCFFVNGEKVEQTAIARIENGNIVPLPENFDRLESLLNDFIAFQGQTIKSAKKLAQMMARKARLMRDVFYKAVQDTSENSSLHDQFEAFKIVLVHDMTEEQFADVYAQTVAYGLFTARLHDKTLEDFSRQEALLLIPKSNPFLRQLFHYIAGPDLDERVVWIVDALCEVYRATDLRAILKDFGTATGQNDPILHFYETFLGEYDKKLKKARGVWYTPEPVVNFIVRAIDDVLKDHFGLKDGLADTSKVKIQVEAQETDKRTKTRRKMFEREVHKVQLLDVATGTGTFLAEAVKQIYSRFEGQEGLWSGYVEQDLLPRLHGFELLMASYAMCHMKLDLLLQETGYKPSNPQKPPRLSVYLTNSLEEHHPDMDTLFARWLSQEANEASHIKKNMPIMVAFGNPPYSVSSSNRGEWIEGLMKDYKKDLNERNINPLSDDYIKFIRYAEHYIEKTGYGVVAMITNNSFIDGVIHRQMRRHLLETFDEIYIYDLHGNSSRQEKCPDGSKDENVFDIRQGVAISIFIKSVANKNKLAKVHHRDSYGLRSIKYERLLKNTLFNEGFENITPQSPEFYFVPKIYEQAKEYKTGFPINELFILDNSGIKTHRDNLVIAQDKNELQNNIESFYSLEIPEQDLLDKIKFKPTKIWNLASKRKGSYDSNKVEQIAFRPFDNRFIYYDLKLIDRGRENIAAHILGNNNYGLVFMRQYAFDIPSYCYISVVNSIIDNRYFISNKGMCQIAPLYLYQSDFGNSKTKTPNFDPKIYARITESVPDITPESLFDYIYAVLHSSAYRKRYAEFLKSDFPRVPYPSDPETFHALVEYGEQLRELHLMESDRLNDPITTYSVDGDHEVKKPRFEDGNVWINETQYFGGVPQVAWEFYIGGYQPAQKWLKDRKGRKLSIDDIRHWQGIIVALTETDKIMRQIGAIDFLPKGKK